MPARLSAFVIWALVAASAMFWGLRLAARSPQAPAHTVSVGDATSVSTDLTRLLGAPPVVPVLGVVAPEMASRFRLTGVMAGKPPGTQGVALIAVDGKLPRAFHVGAPVDGDIVLQSVSLRTAALGPARGTPAVVLELPPLAPAATGTLPPVIPQPTIAQPTIAPEPVARPVLPAAPVRRGMQTPTPQETGQPASMK